MYLKRSKVGNGDIQVSLDREMIGLGPYDGFLMGNALVCMVTYWTRPMVSHDVRLSSSHDLTKLLYYMVSQP